MISPSDVIRRAKTGERGFTLLELLVVLAILALSIAVVAPNVLRIAPRFAAAKTADEIAAGLRRARAAAVLMNVETTFLIRLDERTFEIVGRRNRRKLSDNLDIRVIAARSELASETSPGVRFWPDGSSTGAKIELTEGGRRYDINVDWLTGAVAVEKRAAGDAR